MCPFWQINICSTTKYLDMVHDWFLPFKGLVGDTLIKLSLRGSVVEVASMVECKVLPAFR